LDFKPQTSNLKPQTSNLKPQTYNLRQDITPSSIDQEAPDASLFLCSDRLLQALTRENDEDGD
jgi:hypothetical protein